MKRHFQSPSNAHNALIPFSLPLSLQKSNEGKKNELILLDTKRSNAINIGMTKLPIKTAIKTAILKMDATIINREGKAPLFSFVTCRMVAGPSGAVSSNSL